MADFQFSAKPRESLGRHACRELRNSGFVPATVYGANEAPEAVYLAQKELQKALENDAVFSHILNLTVGTKTQKVVIKELQRDPYKPRLLHIDFQRINTKEKITMHIPVHFLNEEKSPGVKAGGVVSHQMKDIEIRCLPANLPESFEIDVSKLELDEAIHLSEITIPANVELVHPVSEEYDPAIVSVHEPRIAQEDVEAEQKEAELAAETASEHSENEGGAEAENETSDKGDTDKASANEKDDN